MLAASSVCTFGVELWHPLFPGLLLQLCIAACALRLQVGVGTVPGVYHVCPCWWLQILFASRAV